MKSTALIYLVACIFFFSCKEVKKEKETTANPQEIIDKAMVASGADKINGKEICFDFRGKEYISFRKDWRFRLERIEADSTTTIKDVLSNEGFKRYVNDLTIALPDSLASRFGNSVNSVHYFAYLPYGLNDKAVNKTFLKETSINGEPYYVVKVTFNEQNGGDDFEDVFLYWVHKEKYTIDFLAYEFHTNGGGLRFREAYNERNVNGIRFADYKNYKPLDPKTGLYELEEAYKKGTLKLLSQIDLENIYVKQCNNC